MAKEEKNDRKLEVVQELAKSEKRDHGRNVILAAISAIPVAGGPLSSLLSEYLPNWKEERILNFIAELRQEMQNFQDQINEEYIRSEDFALLFEETFLRVLRTNSNIKIAAYKAILVNACITTNIKEIEKEYFLDLVNRLQDIHLLVLSLFWNQEKFGQIHNSSSPTNLAMGGIMHVIRSYMKPLNIEEDLIKSAIRDLDNMGILSGVYQSLGVGMTAQGALYLSGKISTFGRRFINFITI
jgi:hypothetical protein